jgi:hypothetical protein
VSLPATPAAFSNDLLRVATVRRAHRAQGVRREEEAPRGSTLTRELFTIACLGCVVAFFGSVLGSYVCYLGERATNEYAGLVLFDGVVIGVFATIPGAVLAALSAWSAAWWSRRAMWIAGALTSFLCPFLFWIVIVALETTAT